MRIIGIDPALTKTGIGIIDTKNNNINYIYSALIKTDAKLDTASRLLQIHEKLSEILKIYKPDSAAIEETFLNMNPSSSLKLGHARGSIMTSLAIAKIPVFEYSTTSIKKSVSGVGRADKNQITAMMKFLLPQNKAESEDENDALACAICHFHNNPNLKFG